MREIKIFHVVDNSNKISLSNCQSSIFIQYIQLLEPYVGSKYSFYFFFKFSDEILGFLLRKLDCGTNGLNFEAFQYRYLNFVERNTLFIVTYV